MRKSSIILVFLIIGVVTFLPSFSWVDNYDAIKTDSLELCLKKTTDKKKIVDIKNTLAYRYRSNQKELAKELASNALELSIDIGYPRGESYSFIVFGLLNEQNGEIDQAKINFQKAITLREQCCDLPEVASGYRNLGNLYKGTGDFEEAERTFSKALKLLDNQKAPNLRVKILNSLADNYMKSGQPQKALPLFQKSIEINQKIGNQLNQANTLLDLGTLYLVLDNWEKTDSCYKQSLAFYKKLDNLQGEGKAYINLGYYHNTYGEYVEAAAYLKKALQLKEYLSVNDLATIYQNIGVSYKELNKTLDLQDTYLKSLELYTKTENNPQIAITNFNIGELYFEDKAYEKSLTYFLKAKELSSYISQPYLKSQLYQYLGKVYYQLKKSELAYEYSTLHTNLRDSLNRGYIATINFDRNYEEGQKKIVALELKNSEIELKNLEIKRQNQLFSGLVVLFFMSLLVGVVVFIAYRNRQKQKIAEYETDQAYLETEQAYLKIDDLLREQELKTAYAKLAGKDEEQQRIAKDLHDRLGMMLSTIKLYFTDIDLQLKEVKQENRMQHEKANNLLDEACVEVRRIAHNMASGTLAKFGLVEELRGLVNTLNDSNQLKAKLYVHRIKEKLDVTLENKVYKIIQELVGNVLKHANAKKLTIQLNRIDNELNVLVEDDGVGFDAEKAIEKNGMGLRNVTLRVSDLNGRFHIDSGKGHGTTISIDIPITQH